MVTEPDRRRRVSEQIAQHALSLLEWGVAEIVAVQVEEIESEVTEAAGRRTGERILQSLKAGATLGIHGNHLSVQPSGLDRQACKRAGDRRKVSGPILGVARHHPQLLICD